MASWIRLATGDDVARLLAIDTVAAFDVERARQIGQWVTAQSCYVLVEQQLVIGYAVLHQHFFAQPFIEMLMVAPTHRQQGAGLLLIQHLQQMCKTKLFSSCNASNVAMQRLFNKAGFRPSGYIDHLDQGDPELIYVYLV